MPTYRAVILNDHGEEEFREIVAPSDGEAFRQAKNLQVAFVLEREGRLVAQFEPRE